MKPPDFPFLLVFIFSPFNLLFKGCYLNEQELQQHYEDFFEDIFWEMEEKYGAIEEMNVCDNLGDHLLGNVYVMFDREEEAENAVRDLNNRWYAGRPIWAELSPVTDFREACCRLVSITIFFCTTEETKPRGIHVFALFYFNFFKKNIFFFLFLKSRQYEKGECTRGGFCNFMHLKPISPELRWVVREIKKNNFFKKKQTNKQTNKQKKKTNQYQTIPNNTKQ